jgi:tetratricopeptide (TPR) repeat protein
VRIGIYALAKNEEKHAIDWAACTAGADVVVVTDTGSTDSTPQRLRAAGVTVMTGNVIPWRWDDAHNLSLYHLPEDVDACVRLDLDERLQPGWRDAIERAWTGGVNNLRYRYVWSWRAPGVPGLAFLCDRVHARRGYRWASATHEGLVCWTGERRQAIAEGLEIHHHREPGKSHATDLELLRVAVRESPHDARAWWYLAREMDYKGLPETAATFVHYLSMAGGTQTERAYAYRALHRITGDERHLHKAAYEAQSEPDGWQQLAYAHYLRQQWKETLAFSEQALATTGEPTHATDPDARAKAADLAAVAAWNMGLRPQALTYARQALRQCPDDVRLQRNVELMELAASGVHAA